MLQLIGVYGLLHFVSEYFYHKIETLPIHGNVKNKTSILSFSLRSTCYIFHKQSFASSFHFCFLL